MTRTRSPWGAHSHSVHPPKSETGGWSSRVLTPSSAERMTDQSDYAHPRATGYILKSFPTRTLAIMTGPSPRATDSPAPLEISVPLGISIEQFSSVMTAVAGLYKEVGKSLGVETVEGLNVSRHREGSLVLECDPLVAEGVDPASADKVSERLIDDLEKLETGTLPDGFTSAALKHAGKLAGLSNTGAAVVISVSGRSISCGAALKSATATFVNHRTVSWGSVEGYLQMISLRKGAKFNIYELLTDQRIECRFGDDLLVDARDSLGGRVVVSGEIHKRGGDFHYVKVERIHRRPPSTGLPGFDDIRGLFADG